MQVRLKPIAAALLLSGFIVTPALAAANKSLEASVASLKRSSSLKARFARTQ